MADLRGVPGGRTQREAALRPLGPVGLRGLRGQSRPSSVPSHTGCSGSGRVSSGSHLTRGGPAFPRRSVTEPGSSEKGMGPARVGVGEGGDRAAQRELALGSTPGPVCCLCPGPDQAWSIPVPRGPGEGPHSLEARGLCVGCRHPGRARLELLRLPGAPLLQAPRLWGRWMPGPWIPVCYL